MQSSLFRVFDLAVESDVTFPGLVQREGNADLRVITVHSRSPVQEKYEWIHEWKEANGDPFMACGRFENDYLLQFPGLADFELLIEKQQIHIFRDQSCADTTLVHLLLDQVIPRYVCHLGKMVVHASAVDLNEGQMIAFIGASGRGKSTLASSFRQVSGRRVADDCLQLEPTNRGIVAVPAYSSLRLWEDSMNALFPGENHSIEVSQYSRKRQVILDSGLAEGADSPIRLAAMFILGDPSIEPTNDDVTIDSIGGMDAVMALTSSTFPLDVVGKDALRRNFKAVAAVAAAGVPIYQLNYKRRYSLLPEVRNAVIDVMD